MSIADHDDDRDPNHPHDDGWHRLSESVQKGREEGARLLRLKIYRHFRDKS